MKHSLFINRSKNRLLILFYAYTTFNVSQFDMFGLFQFDSNLLGKDRLKSLLDIMCRI